MSEKLKVLDLFSGIGGFSLGLERTGGFETVAFCEIEEYPRKVLAKHWPDVPIVNDICKIEVRQSQRKALNGVSTTSLFYEGKAVYEGPIDVICGGYPCQPFSTAGKRQGEADDRHLWPEMFRLVASTGPSWLIAENVAGHISMGLDQVLSDLEGEGYTAWPLVIPACAVDAPHRRDRVWIIANHDGFQPSTAFMGQDAGADRRDNPGGRSKSARGDLVIREWKGNAADANSKQAFRASITRQERATWLSEPAVGRVAHGVPRRVDRLKALGNAVVPQIPEIIGRAILEAEGLK